MSIDSGVLISWVEPGISIFATFAQLNMLNKATSQIGRCSVYQMEITFLHRCQTTATLPYGQKVMLHQIMLAAANAVVFLNIPYSQFLGRFSPRRLLMHPSRLEKRENDF